MGGDNAPRELVRGAYAASLENSASFILVGDSAEIQRIAREDGLDLSHFDIIDASETVFMDDDPLTVIKAKSNSSMAVSLRMLAAGEGDAVVSTGNTGALFTGATLIVRKIKGIRRPAIAGLLPMECPVLLLDSGANVSVTEEYLCQFAVMGSIYMQKNFGIRSPRVGLLNNGAESCKGTPLQQNTYKMLAAMPEINFVGNVEADKVPFNACDVLVCDGFTGNILLKSMEGMGRLVKKTLKKVFYANAVTKLSALGVKKNLGAELSRLDSSELGGAPILGISKPVIKAHGSSDAKAVKNAVKQAIFYASSGTIVNIAKEIKVYVPTEGGTAN